MARVIKGGAAGGARPARPAARVLAQGDQKKVIDKALYVARQEAEELLRAADDERKAILNEGRRLAAQAREEAMVRGASASFARAAEEALEAFRKRSDRFTEAADDIRTLALEIVRKVLGASPDLAGKDVEKILERGLAQLRGRRRIRVQLPTGRPDDLRHERPNLMKAVATQPDLVVEESDDVRRGFARVVTEVGGALCAEESALDAVARAVNVRETPRPRDHRSLVDDRAARATPRMPARALPTGEFSGADQADEAPSAPVRTDRERTAKLHAGKAAAGVAAHSTVRTAPHDLPDADVEVHDRSSLLRESSTANHDDDDDDATRALPAPPRSPPEARPGARALPAPPPRVAARPAAAASPARPVVVASDRERDAARSARVPTGRVQAGGNAASRVVHVDDALADPLGDDDDLDLYTDEPPRRR